MSDFDDSDGVELSPKSAQSDDLRTRIKQAIDRAHASTHPHSTYDDWLAFAAELAGSDCIYRYACHRCGDFWFDKSERMQRFALLHGKAHADD